MRIRVRMPCGSQDVALAWRTLGCKLAPKLHRPILREHSESRRRYRKRAYRLKVPLTRFFCRAGGTRTHDLLTPRHFGFMSACAVQCCDLRFRTRARPSSVAESAQYRLLKEHSETISICALRFCILICPHMTYGCLRPFSLTTPLTQRPFTAVEGRRLLRRLLGGGVRRRRPNVARRCRALAGTRIGIELYVPMR